MIKIMDQEDRSMEKSRYSPEQVAFGLDRRNSAMLEEMFKALAAQVDEGGIQALELELSRLGEVGR